MMAGNHPASDSRGLRILEMNDRPLFQLVAVFDAGIGSYAIVLEIQKCLPKQDILYFADRANFPYGEKGHDELLAVALDTIRFLETHRPSSIIIASNAPSIMVLEELRQHCTLPLYGVFPPLQQALSVSTSGHIGIMGVRSLVQSDALKRFVGVHSPTPENVALINASPMVELVESGAFLFAPDKTQTAVSQFVADIFAPHPQIDVLTLSSTHLPWLRTFFETARPDCRFLDPATDIVAGLGAGTSGTGTVRGLVTEDQSYDLESLRRMLLQIGVDISLEAVNPPRRS